MRTILALMFSAFLVASTPNPPQPPGTPAPPIGQQVESERRVIALEEQNKVLREFNGAILSTVYWSLGGVITIVVVFAGFGWWSNFKSYEQDKERLKNEICSLIVTSNLEQINKFQEYRNSINESIETKLDARIQLLHADTLEMRSTAASDRAAFDVKLTGITTRVENLLKDINIINKEFAKGEIELRRVEEMVWEISGVPTNILLTQFQGLGAAILADREWQISDSFKRIKLTINGEFIENNRTISKDMYSIVQKQLNLIPDKFKTQREELRELIELILQPDQRDVDA